MQTNTVIFDMDGLLIDSEPLWHEAATEVMKGFGKTLTHEQYVTTVGLRTNEFIEWWFAAFSISPEFALQAENEMHALVIEKIKTKSKPMPGVEHIFNFFIQKNYKIGLASSSAMAIIDVAIEKMGLGKYLSVITSAEKLPNGKPHPQVYMNCAEALGSKPSECICFEDSFNGMIAAKAARMKCVVIPARHEYQHPKFGAADLKISSLINFNELLLQTL